jgi:ubiquinone/menaquinone biosynthesis C-methylase UbiE
VQHYAALNYLTPCERLLFSTYLRPGIAILDLGVGGGRTTPYLSSIAARYIAIDYAPGMIAACRRKFPHLDFRLGDAADLSKFGAETFDAVVMAFNGIDYLIPDEARLRALREIRRVLKPEGILIFSSHNPRSILVRPSWTLKRVREFATGLLDGGSLLFGPFLWLVSVLRKILAVIQSFWQSLVRIALRVPTQAFWKGRGHWVDSAHGGLRTHLATPKNVGSELASLGFRLVRTLGDDYPKDSRLFITDWYYYVFARAGAIVER